MNAMSTRFIPIVGCLVFCFSFHGAVSQDWKTLGPDELFQQARTIALAGSGEESREMLQFILDSHPEYEDARILLARTYAWDGDRTVARAELKKVLETNPDSQDGLSALIDIEIWDGKLEIALQTAERALGAYPTSEEFLYKKASIQHSQAKPAEARHTLDELLKVNPSHSRALSLLSVIKASQKIYTISGSYAIDMFSRTYNPAHYGSIQFSRRNSWGTAILRGNYANRFSTTGMQYEIDLYPKINSGVYAYLNYGYSRSPIFPGNRAGAEVFTRVHKGVELSAGSRFLSLGSRSNIFTYTGSLGINFKNNWVAIRPYITPDKIAKTTYSIFVSFKKYWQNSENYLAVDLGGGFSPDERRFQSGAGFTSDNIYILRAQRGSITLQRSIAPTLLIIASAGAIRQELIFETGSYMYIVNTSVGIRKKF